MYKSSIHQKIQYHHLSLFYLYEYNYIGKPNENHFPFLKILTVAKARLGEVEKEFNIT